MNMINEEIADELMKLAESFIVRMRTGDPRPGGAEAFALGLATGAILRERANWLPRNRPALPVPGADELSKRLMER